MLPDRISSSIYSILIIIIIKITAKHEETTLVFIFEDFITYRLVISKFPDFSLTCAEISKFPDKFQNSLTIP